MLSVATILIFTSGCHLLNLIDLVYKFKRKIDSLYFACENEEKQINDSTFISSEVSKDCETHFRQKKPCYRPNCSYKNMRKLLDRLNCCKKTLDICINLLSCQDIAECILDVALMKNVKVRVICDTVMYKNSGSQIHMLVKAGVDVRAPSDRMMHAKFAIMDSQVLLLGSMNWTLQGLHGNWDSFTATSHPSIVKHYVRAFSLMFNHPKIVLY